MCLAAVLTAAAASAQTCPELRVRNTDGNYIVPGVQGDIPYSERFALDAYVQSGGGRRPSVIVVHGGNWSSGSRSAHVGQILELLSRAGYHWFSVDYSLGGLPGYEASLEDLRAAIAFIRCRSRELGVDAGRLILLGEDSGAHLAALLAAERPAGVLGAILIGGFYDLRKITAIAAAAPAVDLQRGSPLERVPPRMLPLLVVHGGGDRDVPIEQARTYCDRVRQRGGRCQLVEAEGASHRSENWWPSQWSYKQEITRWLEQFGGTSPLTHQPRPGAIQKDIVFNPAAGLALDAFVPPGATPVPAVIIVHGGGWEAGDKVTYVTPLFEPLARAGLAWFSIDYRLTPAALHQEQLQDVRSAIRFIREHHARFNIDPARIVLLGESASGQMVTQLAAEDASLAGVVSFYGVYDLGAMVTDASPRSLLVRLFRRTVLDEGARALLRDFSPLHTAHAKMPPLLLINGTGERLWDQARAFAARLTELGARHELIALEGAPHGLENWEGHPEWTTYKDRLVSWIQRMVR